MPGKNWRIFKIFGIDVYINLSLVFGLAYFSLILEFGITQALKEDFPGMFSSPSLVGWYCSIAISILVFVSIFLHELGHSLVAKLFGMKVSGITLFILGGVSNIDELEKATARRIFFVTAAGPLVSVALGVIFFLVYGMFDGSSATQVSVLAFLIVAYLMSINIVIAIFNLIPVYPLDGGRIFATLLQFIGVSKANAQNIASYVGIGMCCVLICAGLAGIVGRLPLPVFNSVWLIMISGFLLMINLAERRGRNE